jgi:glycosyltransferase involved in cell wall biosynthesis
MDAEHRPDEVDVVLPVLDEAAALPWVLGAMPVGYRALVVDNGSTDGSGDLARALGATVVSEARRGFGSACAAGLAAATAPIVAFCDADASLDPAGLPTVVAPVVGGEADMVLGARRPVGRGAWPSHARLANRYLAHRIRRVTGLALTDLGPMRAARRDDLLALGIADRRFGWPLEMVLRAAAAGWRVAEVPVSYAPRMGRSKVTGTLSGTLRAARDMRRVLRAAQAAAGAPPGSTRSGGVEA